MTGWKNSQSSPRRLRKPKSALLIRVENAEIQLRYREQDEEAIRPDTGPPAPSRRLRVPARHGARDSQEKARRAHTRHHATRR